MNIDTYIEDRLDAQIAWYDKKSIRCQKSYKCIQTIEIILAALIPFLAGYTSFPCIIFIIAVIGVVLTILQALTKMNKYHELWLEYRTTCELLRHQKFLYLTKSGPYSSGTETSEQILVTNVEQIISSENNQWKIDNNSRKCDSPNK